MYHQHINGFESFLLIHSISILLLFNEQKRIQIAKIYYIISHCSHCNWNIELSLTNQWKNKYTLNVCFMSICILGFYFLFF